MGIIIVIILIVIFHKLTYKKAFEDSSKSVKENIAIESKERIEDEEHEKSTIFTYSIDTKKRTLSDFSTFFENSTETVYEYNIVDKKIWYRTVSDILNRKPLILNGMIVEKNVPEPLTGYSKTKEETMQELNEDIQWKQLDSWVLTLQIMVYSPDIYSKYDINKLIEDKFNKISLFNSTRLKIKGIKYEKIGKDIFDNGKIFYEYVITNDGELSNHQREELANLEKNFGWDYSFCTDSDEIFLKKVKSIL